MSHSKAALPQIEKWTTEDVHQWLTEEVKVDKTCADNFVEEEVSGKYLIDFEKTDILDLGIKHGPAVKIKSHLKKIREGSKHELQIPAYVANWTKEQVYQWLLQHADVYSKYAERLHEEDVCGDCLVCFEKQDFLDLDVKNGPAVRILKELHKLKDKPEPALEPILPPTALQKDAPQPTQPELNPSQQPQPFDNTDLKKEEINRNALSKTPMPAETVLEENKSQHTGKQQEPKPLGSKTNEDVKQKIPQTQNTNCWDGETLQSSLKIQKILADLLKEELKTFHFHLQEYRRHKNQPIPRGNLEGKDTIDTAKLLLSHYGNVDALQVTRDILYQIDQRDLASRLEKDMGPLKLQSHSDDALKRESHQGDKLKNLLTCGGNSLDNYDRFVVIVNKSKPGQAEHLQFLSTLKLFCVLDLDPNSNAPGGVCHSYRDTRVANLHIPSQYQGQTDSVIKNLNLNQQTSWVFCNGRNDIDDESNKELDYKNWLRKSCSDVEQLVSFICTPDVLDGIGLIIFLLLSPVDSEKDPIFDIYKSFLKRTDEENIITICESQSTYLKWKELTQEKCDSDIDPLSIYELTLSQVNGTVMALEPFNQTEKLLPSSDSSAVVLKQKDEDLMTALDILCLNHCENGYDENSSEFAAFRMKVEEEFYRGGKVKWWNFYFCDIDKDRPFIKRDKYESLKKLVRNQQDSNNTCVLLNFFHHPGCGGTTLAMHVMWDLRKEFRCAVLKDNTLPKAEVADQVIKLMKLESGKPSPVLLLVDDSKDTQNAYELVYCIRKAREGYSNRNTDDTKNSKVIILNCVRSQSPKEQYKQQNPMQSQFITASLTKEEQRDFEKKLKELKETHEKPENFYSFMIMKSNFDRKYTADLAHNTLENFDFNTKQAQLFAFLALLNTYVTKSEISLSCCKDFCEIKMLRWHADNVLDRMKPYSNLLTIVKRGGGRKGVTILHHLIATACLEELEKSHSLKVSDIAMEILECDLFFRDASVQSRFMVSIRRMLIERQRKKDGDEREPFSPFIDKVHSQQGRQTVQEIFEKASSKFETLASIPQALARYLYINERDFPEALKWAENAKNITENPYTFDTIGQVHKSNLKSNIDRVKQETSHNPDDLKTNIKIAENAITAFKRAQELERTEDELEEETADDDSEDYPKNSYNVKGYVGVLDIAFLVFEILGRLPLFEESDPKKKKYLKCFLEKEIPISSMYTESNEINRYVKIINENEYFLLNLKTEVKDIFEHLECYYTYFKANTSEFDSKNRLIVTGHFKKYVMLFCTEPEEKKKERHNNPNLSVKIITEERRLFLEWKRADTFAGILQHLDKPPQEIERITECYAFLQQQQQFDSKGQKMKETINYLLSNVVLNLLKPTSKHVQSYSFLSTLLLKTLQDVGLYYRFPDPYYLALLLFWPSPSEQNPEIGKYISAIKNSSRKRLNLLVKNRGTVAHVYLGKGKGFKRLVSKPQLDKNFREMDRGIDRCALAQLWRSGDIFKYEKIINRLHRVSGTIEQGQVYATYGTLKLPVHPALGAGIRSGWSTEKVSFYLGFAIDGPLAYDIQYES
ncbi:sterile alpha motif domain-containing protein 9-like [Sphaeramia orbicularis]|uniref:sterile alpha motif domain-containing protein 9-like n=1 Tax=Sphaeramia orbicularis TaxID=375764 RepID=UPI001180274B|nr:sterile alpha motif domain-containing protein 9-like [Sphaeramia orbicularis]